MQKEKPTTLGDVLDAISKASQRTQDNFDKIDLRFDEVGLKISKARDEAFVHADRKAAEVIAEIGKRINTHKEQDKKFKTGLIDVMKNNTLASKPELDQLTVLI